MLHHHELEKYTFFSQIANNRKVLPLPYQSGVSQLAFIYLQANKQTFITLQNKKKKKKKHTHTPTETKPPLQKKVTNVKYNQAPSMSAL